MVGAVRGYNKPAWWGEVRVKIFNMIGSVGTAVAVGAATPCSPRPLVIFADGCSRSTAVLLLAHRLLSHHGLHTLLPVYEPMLCAQNRFCHPEAAHNGTPAIVDALREEVQWGSSQQCRPVLLKGHCGMDSAWLKYAAALKSLGARTVAMYRKNVLDVTICEIRDCMNREHVGRVVASPDGSAAANCSISRRALPTREQPPVWLDTTRLVATLRKRVYRNAQACVRHSFTDAPRFSSDELLGASGWASGAALNASARAWAGLLTHLWGISGGSASASADVPPPTAASVRDQLLDAARADTFSATAARAPPLPHAQLIANAVEVKAVLAGAGPPLDRLWRD